MNFFLLTKPLTCYKGEDILKTAQNRYRQWWGFCDAYIQPGYQQYLTQFVWKILCLAWLALIHSSFIETQTCVSDMAYRLFSPSHYIELLMSVEYMETYFIKLQHQFRPRKWICQCRLQRSHTFPSNKWEYLKTFNPVSQCDPCGPKGTGALQYWIIDSLVVIILPPIATVSLRDVTHDLFFFHYQSSIYHSGLLVFVLGHSYAFPVHVKQT